MKVDELPESGRGRPDHYEIEQVVAQYQERRYATGWGLWKHQRKVELLKSWIDPGDSLLEVGCGPGRFYEVTRRCHQVVELDRSLPMLQAYQAHCRSRSDTPLPFVCADGARLPFADDSFDTVLCIRLLAHFRDEFRARFLSELRRVCRQQVIVDGRHLYNLRFASRWVRRRLGFSHADKLRHTKGQFQREFSGAGLQIEKTKSIAWGLSGRFLVRARKI